MEKYQTFLEQIKEDEYFCEDNADYSESYVHERYNENVFTNTQLAILRNPPKDAVEAVRDRIQRSFEKKLIWTD